MEVHHHPHTERKKFKHYLFEFFMLFLAVFCGFLAENMREHYIEHQREKQYIHSFTEDLRTDITQAKVLAPQLEILIARLDSLSEELNSSNNDSPPLVVFKQLSMSIGFPDYIYTDRTMQQLKNAGGMRLIRNAGVADSIVMYDTWVRRGLAHQDLVNSVYMPRLFDKINTLFNIPVLNNLAKYINTGMDTSNLKKVLLLTDDKNDIVKFNNQILDYRLSINILLKYVLQNKEMATRLLSFIKKEYHLK
ncbi:MAG: hypothetical protein KF825_14375 [Ferruginibacter sp.]|nr:hypothetical protein [Bacteroidota bacterium]MBX2935427.1 hypothetical protein [Ferruginibacter sp.]